MEKFTQVATAKNYQIIISQIKNMIIAGQLKTGDKLPSERELAEQFQVSRVSVREALKGLEIMGVLESRQGGGNFIVNNLSASLSDNLTMVYQLSGATARNIVQVRKAIEVEATRSIIETKNTAAVRQLAAVVGRMRAAASYEAFTPLDFLFHQVIIDQCGNPLFAALFQASMSLYDQHIQAVNTRTSSEWALDKIVHLHEEIFRALEAFDLPACSKVLDYHYSEMD